ncbi:MAG: HDOD domain-containing protein [Epsilonproteobacteria bacterium]|nr:HDOD domain-containing protein [Campylobacterota bacterium]
MVEDIIKKIKALPPLPESVIKVKEICNDPESEIKDLVDVVKEDPMFTADILKAANSPLYGFSRQITSIDQAISLFGMGTIQGFAISYAVRKTMDIDLSPYGATRQHLTKVSTLQNALSFGWGSRQVEIRQSEAITLSLLMELGKAVASLVLIERGTDKAFHEKISGVESIEEIAAIEKEVLGINSEWIAALMFKHWQFSESMITMMRHILTPDEAPENLRRQTQLLHIVKEAANFIDPLGEPAVQSALEKADRFGFDAESLREAIEKIEY